MEEPAKKNPSAAARESKVGFDKVILALAFLGLAGSIGMLFYGDLFRDEAETGLAVGKFAASTGDVRRRAHNGVAWSNSRVGDGVFEGDSVFTGEASVASIELEKGNTLEIDPQSLVVVRTTRDEVELDLKRGSLRGNIDSDKKIVLKVDGKREELASKKAKVHIVRSNASASPRLEVLKGEVSVKPENAAAAETIREKETARIDAKSTEVKAARSLDIELLEPANRAVAWPAPDEPARFKWRASDPSAKLVLEIARDSSFSPILAAAKPSASGQASIKDLPRAGELRWRVRPEDEAVLSDPQERAFALWPNEPPQLDVPLQAQSIIISPLAEKPIALARFSWTDRAGSKSFRLQVARASEGLKHPLIDQPTAESSIDGVALPAGQYIWRVQGAHPERKNPPWSATRSFAVASPKKLPAPVLKNPTLTFSLPTGSIERAGTGPGAGTPVVKAEGLAPMQWTLVEGADRYLIERAPSDKFENAAKDEVGDGSFQLAKAAPGPISWRVRAHASDGRISEPSAIGHWLLLAPVPRTKEVVPLAQSFSTPEELAAAKGSFAFSWEASQWASAYELQVSSNKSFARPQEYKTDATEKEVAVAAPGSYAWRVRSVDAASGPLSLWSEARVAKYSKELKAPEPRAIAAIEPTPMPTPKPTPMPTPVEEILAPPAALEPRPSTSVVALRGSSSFVSFKWTPVGGATSYRLEISTDRAFASTSRAVDVSKTSFFVHSLPAGNYFWRVRATVKQKPTLWSEPTQLNVTATK